MARKNIKSLTVARELPSYASGQALVEEQAGEIFKCLENKSFTETAYEFGLDRFYSSEDSMRSAITRAYNLVLDDGKRFGLQPEEVAFIQGKIQGRNVGRKSPETVREEQTIKSLDISSQINETRDLVASLVRKKLEYLNRNPKALKEEKLKDLGWLLGVLFDKGQIVAGQATEHIAVMSNIPQNIDPAEAMKAILKMREESIANS